MHFSHRILTLSVDEHDVRERVVVDAELGRAERGVRHPERVQAAGERVAHLRAQRPEVEHVLRRAELP